MHDQEPSQKGMLSTLYDKAAQSTHPKTWKTLFFMGTTLLWPVAWLISPIWEAIYRPHASALTKNTTYGWRVARWLATGALVFGVLVGLSILTGGFFPAVLSLSGLTLSLVWSGAIALATAGLLALQDIMRDGVDFYAAYEREKGYAHNHETAFSDLSNDATLPRPAKAHWRYFARWLLPSLLLTAIIVLSAGAIPAIAIGGAAGTSVLATIMGSLSAAGITSMWAQVGIFAAGVFGSLAVMHALGTLSMLTSSYYSSAHRPKTRTFFRYLAKGLHFTGFLTVMALTFSNLAILAALKMGLMTTPAAAAPAATGTFTAAAPVIAAESSWMTTLPIIAGIYTGISVALSALLGMLGVVLNRSTHHADDTDSNGREADSSIQPTISVMDPGIPPSQKITKEVKGENKRSSHRRAPSISTTKTIIKKLPKQFFYDPQEKAINWNGQYLRHVLSKQSKQSELTRMTFDPKDGGGRRPVYYCTQTQKLWISDPNNPNNYVANKVQLPEKATMTALPRDNQKKSKKSKSKTPPRTSNSQATTTEEGYYYNDQKSLQVSNTDATVHPVVYVDQNNCPEKVIMRDYLVGTEKKDLNVYFDPQEKELLALDGAVHIAQCTPTHCNPKTLEPYPGSLAQNSGNTLTM